MFGRLTGRPSADAITPASKFQRLSEAQNEIVADIAAICPNVLYPSTAYASLPTLTTTDNQIFTFGTDANGYAIAPMGKVGIYPQLNAIPDSPWREGVDFVKSGATAIRIPNNRSYSGTLYWWGITPPADITASVQPALFPEASRELIVLKAGGDFALEYNRNPDLAASLQSRYDKRFVRWCLMWRTQYKRGGALVFTGMRLAEMGAYNSPI